MLTQRSLEMSQNNETLPMSFRNICFDEKIKKEIILNPLQVSFSPQEKTHNFYYLPISHMSRFLSVKLQYFSYPSV